MLHLLSGSSKWDMVAIIKILLIDFVYYRARKKLNISS